jgi:hypothetical protein
MVKVVRLKYLFMTTKLRLAEKLLNELYAIEPTNERIYIQQASAPIRTFDG